MGADRIQELRNQRNLIIQQLDWINQEIDRETLATFPSPSPKTSRLIEAFPADRPVAGALADPENTSSQSVVVDLYQELGPDVKGAAAETKRGCLMIGGLGFTALAGLFAYVILWYQ